MPSSFRPSRHRIARRVSCALLLACLPFFASVLPATYLHAQDEALKPFAKFEAPPAPAWLDSAVIYEIYTRTFSKEGNFNAITARLDTLQQLGVNVLWIMPISPIGREHRLGRLGSPYSIQDYYAIDPDLGSKADFSALVQAAHQHHMRVILDMVADHTSWDSVMMAHPDFYQHDAAGKIISPHGWSDVAGLNYANPGLRRYMDDMFLYWMKTFDLDGFRCDAANFVPTDFWEQLRPQIKRIRPDALLLAESSTPELMRSAFDLDYGWPLLATFDKVIESGQPASSIRQQIEEQASIFPKHTQHMLTSDDHDTARATVRYGAGGAMAASALVFTLPGVPMLYNGMEVGDATESGSPELFDKYDVDWNAASEFPKFPVFYHALIALRESSTALQHGDITWLHNSDEQHVVTFLRSSAEETDLVAVNLSATPFRGTVEADAGPWQEVSLTKERPPANAVPALSLDAFQVRILRHMNHADH
jgi:cyclomaltodextrinase